MTHYTQKYRVVHIGSLDMRDLATFLNQMYKENNETVVALTVDFVLFTSGSPPESNACTVIIDGVVFDAPCEVAELLKSVSLERDLLLRKIKLAALERDREFMEESK